MRNCNEFSENICYEIDKEYDAIRHDLYTSGTSDIIQSLERIISQRALCQALDIVAKRHEIPAREIRQIYFIRGNQDGKNGNQSTQWH
jgi:hypothetical protein